MSAGTFAPADLSRVLTRKVGRAIQDYRMIREGDRVMVAVSGGKDSYTLLDLLEKLRRRSPVRFELVACNVDQGYSGFRSDVIEEHLKAGGYRYRIESTEIAGTIRRKMDPTDTLCSLCARLRRGALYRLADETGCNKIALGHHADDIIETLLMLQFFNGQIKSMPPVLRAENGRHTVIRPMAYVWESEVVEYTRANRFPVVCCCCSACGDASLQRQQIKSFLRRLEEGHPGVKASLLKATGNVHLAHLMDPRHLPVAEEAAHGEGRSSLNPAGTTDSPKAEPSASRPGSARSAGGGRRAPDRNRDAERGRPRPSDSRG
jgi:tRNA 2-thiocytidine biosynthesis protein TtcA